MSIGPLTPLPPFQWYVLENFPFIEYDFDAITNWQLFCKLGEEINKIISQTNNLGTQVATLTTNYQSLYNYLTNLNLQDEVNKKLDEMALDGTLENLINQEILGNIKNNVQAIYNNTTFKPLVYASMYMIDDTEETIKARILKWKEMQVKGIIVLINFNNDDNLTIQDDLTKCLNLMNYAKSQGLEVNTIKFHCLLRDRVDSATLTTYENQVNNVLETLQAKAFGITRITVFNELPYIYGPNATSATKTQAISIINNLKNEGYEIGITCSNLELGIGYMIQYSPNIANVVDFFAYNYYQIFPFKKELTNKQDSKFAWEKAFDATYTYLQQYPNKKIILSETGCLNNWLNMMNPSDFRLNQYPANGKTYPIYFDGLFNNAVANTNLSEVWLWYDEVMTNYQDVIDYFKYYLGGDING